MDNPFLIIDKRLEEIERCLKQIICLSSSLLNDSIKPCRSEDIELNVDQLAEYLGCVKSTVLRYKREGVIPFYQAGRSAYFKKDEVDMALSSRRNKRR